MEPDAVSWLAAARDEVELACRSLVLASPEALASSEKALERAAAVLRQGRNTRDWTSNGESARIEASRVQASIRHAGCLLRSASRYHAGWLRILSAMTGGYSPRGEAAAMPGLRRISLLG
jgi:hypothetical protein